MRFSLRLLVTTTAIVCAAASCGDAARTPKTQDRLRAPAAGTADATGQVACSTESVKRHQRGPASFDVELDDVKARLSGDLVTRGYEQWMNGPRLQMQTVGAAATHFALRAEAHSLHHRYRPEPVRLDGSDIGGYLCLGRFGADEPIRAVAATYLGGVHCCTTFRVFDPRSGRETRFDTGNAGGSLIVADGQPLLRTRDDAFSYAFTAFAYSGAPIRLLRPTGAGLSDVTRDHPDLVRRDAQFWWNRYEHPQRFDVGFGSLAAWAADEDLLGNDEQVWQTLDDLAASGQLERPKGEFSTSWPDGESYVAALKQFLTDRGYRTD